MKRWVVILLSGAAFVLLLAVIIILSSGETDDSKFVIGKPLPPGKVTPQLTAAYMDQAVLLAPDGTLWTWGGNPSMPGVVMTGLAGRFGGSTLVAAPQRISADTDWTRAALASVGVVALKSDGSIWMWSNIRGGAFGGPPKTSGNYVLPTRIGTDSDWAEVSGMTSHFMALKTDGSLWGWGQNESGQIGDGTTTNGTGSRTTPIQVGTDRDWKTISAGAFNSYALKRDGSLWGWGSDVNSGQPQQTNVFSPEQIGSDTNWAALSAGDFHLLALKSDGTIWVRGQNEHITAPAAFSSRGNYFDRSIMVQVGTDSDWDRICSGQNSIFARKRDGTWWACGSDTSWQLGVNSPSMPVASGATPSRAAPGGVVMRPQNTASPQRLPFDFDAWAIASGGQSTVLLTKDGTIWSWGTRLGVSQSGLHGKGLKAMYTNAVAWVEKKLHPNAQTQTPAAARGGRGGIRFVGSGWATAPNDTVTDYSPHRVWTMPSDMRNALEKNAVHSTNTPPPKNP